MVNVMQVSKFIYLVSLSDLPNIESVNSGITSHQHVGHTGMPKTLEKRGIKSQGGGGNLRHDHLCFKRKLSRTG